MISKLYKVPSEQGNPVSFSMLKDICIELCRIPLDPTIEVVVEGTEGEALPRQSVKDAKEKLKMIREGNLELPDAQKCDQCSISKAGYYDASGIETGVPGEGKFGY